MCQSFLTRDQSLLKCCVTARYPEHQNALISNSDFCCDGNVRDPAICGSANVYNRNLAVEDVKWWAVLSLNQRPFAPGKGVISSGPFLIDTNHREGALLVGPLAVMMKNRVDPDGYTDHLGDVDLRNTKIKLRLKIEADGARGAKDLAGGKVVLWFQSALPRAAVAGNNRLTMPGRWANYIYSRDITKEAMTGQRVEIDVRPDLNDWTCLGRNPIDIRPMIGSAAKYTCALNQDEFAYAMSQPVNGGVLFLLAPERADGDNWLTTTSPHVREIILDGVKFVLSEFTIERDQDR